METIQFEKSGAIARVWLNRPDAANGFNPTMARELAMVAARCDSDPEIKVVLLSGVGKFFSAGGDLKAMSSFEGSTPEFVKTLADDLHRGISTFARMDAVLVVAVNGMAAGAGFSLAVSGDLVIASESASFTMAYTRAGLSPDGSSSYYLPRLIGVRKTQELMLTNRMLSARDALDWGLLNRVVPDEALEAEAMGLAHSLAKGSKGSQAVVKKLLLSTFSHGLEEQMEIEGRHIAACAGSADGQEGIKAFTEKRAPVFS